MGKSKGKYKVYFALGKAKMFRCTHGSEWVDDVSEVVGLLDFLLSEEDVISIYIQKNKFRVQIWGCPDANFCIFEIQDGAIHSRKFLKDEVRKINPQLLEEYVNDPGKFGFAAESV